MNEPASQASSPLGAYSHRNVWRISAPLILSNVSVPLLGIVDTAVLGHLERPDYLAAVAVGSTIFSFLFMGMNFLRMGTTGLTAQALGRGDNAGLRSVLGRSLVISVSLGLLLVVLQDPVLGLSLKLIGPGPEVQSNAEIYYRIRIWNAPATLSTFVIIGWFIGVQNGRGPLIVLLTINAVNVLLDFLFVVGMGMKTAGVAWASLIAEYSGLGIGVLIVRYGLREYPGGWSGRLLSLSSFRELFSINGNLFIRTMTLLFAFGFLTAQGARLGKVVLAANAVLLNFQYFMAYALDGFANAAEALVGRAIGEGTRAGFERAVAVSLQWSVLVAAIFTLLYGLFGSWIVNLMTDLAGIREAAETYLIWLVVSPLISVWSFTFDGIYVGATRAREMRNAMLVSTFLVYLPAWFLFRSYGNHGLWLAFTLLMAARGATLYWLYRRTDWVPGKP